MKSKDEYANVEYPKSYKQDWKTQGVKLDKDGVPSADDAPVDQIQDEQAAAKKPKAKDEAEELDAFDDCLVDDGMTEVEVGDTVWVAQKEAGRKATLPKPIKDKQPKHAAPSQDISLTFVPFQVPQYDFVRVIRDDDIWQRFVSKKLPLVDEDSIAHGYVLESYDRGLDQTTWGFPTNQCTFLSERKAPGTNKHTKMASWLMDGFVFSDNGEVDGSMVRVGPDASGQAEKFEKGDKAIEVRGAGGDIDGKGEDNGDVASEVGGICGDGDEDEAEIRGVTSKDRGGQPGTAKGVSMAITE